MAAEIQAEVHLFRFGVSVAGERIMEGSTKETVIIVHWLLMRSGADGIAQPSRSPPSLTKRCKNAALPLGAGHIAAKAITCFDGPAKTIGPRERVRHPA